MYKKIIVPLEELHYRVDGVENKYLISENNRSIGLFAVNKDYVIPAQIAPQDLCVYVFEGNIEIELDDKIFNMKKGELILVPKATVYTFKLVESSKLLIIRI